MPCKHQRVQRGKSNIHNVLVQQKFCWAFTPPYQRLHRGESISYHFPSVELLVPKEGLPYITSFNRSFHPVSCDSLFASLSTWIKVDLQTPLLGGGWYSVTAQTLLPHNTCWNKEKFPATDLSCYVMTAFSCCFFLLSLTRNRVPSGCPVSVSVSLPNQQTYCLWTG